MRMLTGVIIFIICAPLIGTWFIKPDKSDREEQESDTSVINECFEISVREENGTFYYKPETLTGLLMYRAIPEDAAFTSSEDYIVRFDEVYDPEQEYLKALAIVCRSCVVAAWEQAQRPEVLDYGTMKLEAQELHRIIQTDAVYLKVPPDANALLCGGKDVKLKEIWQAVDATKGAVITREGMVMAAPFFTTTSSDMLVGEAGAGEGFSLNYAYELAVSGMNFYELLKYFYEDIRVIIYEEIHE